MKNAAVVTMDEAQQNNRCGVCKLAWRKCKCHPEARTESLLSLLSNELIFPNIHNRHLCVFAYHSYQRWTSQSDGEDDFSAACIPPWEGWYAAWINLGNSMALNVPWSETPVLQCSVHYQDGTSLDGFLQRNGKLLVNIPGPCPPHGRDYDYDRRMMRAHVQVSQRLTLEEINGCLRGVVHGTNNVPNNARKVSHVFSVLENNEREVVMCKLAERDGAEIGFVSVQTDKLAKYAPHLFEEMRWRLRKRFTKDIGKVVQQYLASLFRRASEADTAARFAYCSGWLRTMPKSTSLLQAIVKDLPALAAVMREDE